MGGGSPVVLTSSSSVVLTPKHFPLLLQMLSSQGSKCFSENEIHLVHNIAVNYNMMDQSFITGITCALPVGGNFPSVYVPYNNAIFI